MEALQLVMPGYQLEFYQCEFCNIKYKFNSCVLRISGAFGEVVEPQKANVEGLVGSSLVLLEGAATEAVCCKHSFIYKECHGDLKMRSITYTKLSLSNGRWFFVQYQDRM